MNLHGALESAFDPIARDGRGFVEVQVHVQRALATLARHRSPEVAQAARILSRRALAHAEQGLLLAEDIARVRALAAPAGSAPLAVPSRAG